MKKIVSLSLAGIMALMSIPSAFAIVTGGNCVVCGDETSTICDVCQSYYCENCDPCNYNDWGLGTQVEYVANADASREYTITVPALLRPGQSGTVTLEGYWPSDATVKVTAEEKVEVVNNINSADKKELAVTFASIEKAGSNTAVVTASAPVSVANIENALFGKWAGKFNYNVDYVAGSGNTGSGTTEPSDPDTGDDEPVTIGGSVTFSDGVTLSWAELQLEENGTKYGYDASLITATKTTDRVFAENANVTSVTIPDGVNLHEYTFYKCTNLTSVTFVGTAQTSNATFRDCTALTNVDLGNLKSLGGWTFRGCTSLTSIDIPVTVTSLNYAFLECSNLTKINYEGTIEQWNAMMGSDSGLASGTEVNCSDGTITLS